MSNMTKKESKKGVKMKIFLTALTDF